MRFSLTSSTLFVAFAMLAAPATAGTTTCSIPTSCAVIQNTSTGPAVHAQSVSGFGIRSTSSSGGGVYASSGSGTLMSAGLDGESTNSTDQDTAGVFGLAGNMAGSAPTYGVVAYGKLNGIIGGTTAGSTDAAGVYGADYAKQAGNAGVLGDTQYGFGVLGESGDYAGDGYVGYPIGVYGYANTYSGTNTGIGVLGEGDTDAVYASNTATTGRVCLACVNYLITAANGSAGFTVDNSGNVNVTGKLTTPKGTYVQTRGASGATRLSYGQRTTSPELEDAGEAQLVGGRAFVRIDAALADDIDRTRPYLVFVTPEADSKGLYVSERSPAGFVVREQQGGRSTLVFQYRIVAKPVNESGERLAITSAMDVPKPLARKSLPNAKRPRSPLDDLRARIGPAAFAKAVREYERLRTSP